MNGVFSSELVGRKSARAEWDLQLQNGEFSCAKRRLGKSVYVLQRCCLSGARRSRRIRKTDGPAGSSTSLE